MNIGIPGTGIGGIFYVVAALAAPFRRSAQRRRSGTFRCWILALGVLAGIFVTGWLLGFVLRPETNAQVTVGTMVVLSPHHTENVVRWASLFASVLLLATVLQAVQIARLVLNWKRKKS